MDLDYSTIFLDKNGTIMFDGDRLDADQNFYATYVNFGGDVLLESDVYGIIEASVSDLFAYYSDPEFYDDFPSVRSVIEKRAAGIAESEMHLLEEIVAEHELGKIPTSTADCVAALSRHYRLILVSNLWSDKARSLAELRRAGVLDLFEQTVFSSDGRSIKPSRRIFDRAMALASAAPTEILVVGDSLKRDVAGAIAAGLDSAWLSREESPSGAPKPTHRIATLAELIP